MSLMNAGVDSTKDETYMKNWIEIEYIYIYVYIDQVGNDASDTVYQAPFPFTALWPYASSTALTRLARLVPLPNPPDFRVIHPAEFELR